MHPAAIASVALLDYLQKTGQQSVVRRLSGIDVAETAAAPRNENGSPVAARSRRAAS